MENAQWRIENGLLRVQVQPFCIIHSPLSIRPAPLRRGLKRTGHEHCPDPSGRGVFLPRCASRSAAHSPSLSQALTDADWTIKAGYATIAVNGSLVCCIKRHDRNSARW
jgi:hypothetical protein